jgi:DNA replication protein DnaD
MLSENKKQGWIHQPHLVKNLEKEFGSMVSKLQVGMLLYVVKHSRPDIVNGVRKLSKALDGVTPKVMQ